MQKRINSISKILTVSSIVILLTLPASAQDEEGLIPKIWKKLTIKNRPAQTSQASSVISEQKEPLQASNKPMLMMTKEEMIRQVKYELVFNEGILEQIQELKKCKDKNGKEFYTYLKDKEEVNLENLDENSLNELLYKMHIQETYQQAGVVQEQMKAANEAQRVSAVQQNMPHAPTPLPPRPPSPPPQQPPRR